MKKIHENDYWDKFTTETECDLYKVQRQIECNKMNKQDIKPEANLKAENVFQNIILKMISHKRKYQKYTTSK